MVVLGGGQGSFGLKRGIIKKQRMREGSVDLTILMERAGKNYSMKFFGGQIHSAVNNGFHDASQFVYASRCSHTLYLRVSNVFLYARFFFDLRGPHRVSFSVMMGKC